MDGGLPLPLPQPLPPERTPSTTTTTPGTDDDAQQNTRFLDEAHHHRQAVQHHHQVTNRESEDVLRSAAAAASVGTGSARRPLPNVPPPPATPPPPPPPIKGVSSHTFQQGSSSSGAAVLPTVLRPLPRIPPAYCAEASGSGATCSTSGDLGPGRTDSSHPNPHSQQCPPTPRLSAGNTNMPPTGSCSAASSNGIPGLPHPPPPRPPSRQALQHQKRQEQKKRERKEREREKERGEHESGGAAERTSPRAPSHSRNPSLVKGNGAAVSLAVPFVLNSATLAPAGTHNLPLQTHPPLVSTTSKSAVASGLTSTSPQKFQTIVRSRSRGHSITEGADVLVVQGARRITIMQQKNPSASRSASVRRRGRREKSADSCLESSYRVLKHGAEEVMEQAGRRKGPGVVTPSPAASSGGEGARSAPSTPGIGTTVAPSAVGRPRGDTLPPFVGSTWHKGVGTASPGVGGSASARPSPASPGQQYQSQPQHHQQRPARPKLNTAFDLTTAGASNNSTTSPLKPIGARVPGAGAGIGGSTTTGATASTTAATTARQRTLSASSISGPIGRRPVVSISTASKVYREYNAQQQRGGGGGSGGGSGYVTSTPSSPTMATPTALTGSRSFRGLPTPVATTPTSGFPMAARRPLPAPGRTAGLDGGSGSSSGSGGHGAGAGAGVERSKSPSPRLPFSPSRLDKDKGREREKERARRRRGLSPHAGSTTSSSASAASSPPSSAFGSPMTSASSSSMAGSMVGVGGLSVLPNESGIMRMQGQLTFGVRQQYRPQHQGYLHQPQPQPPPPQRQRHHLSLFAPVEEDKAAPLHSHPMPASAAAWSRELQRSGEGSGSSSSSGDKAISPIVVGRSMFNAPVGVVSGHVHHHHQEWYRGEEGDGAHGEGGGEEDDGYYYDPSSQDRREYVDDVGVEGIGMVEGVFYSRSPSPIVYARPDSRGNLSSSSSLGRGAQSDDDVEEGEVAEPSSSQRKRHRNSGHRQKQKVKKKRNSDQRHGSRNSSPASSFRASSRRSSLSSSRGDVSSSSGDSFMSVGKSRRRRVRAQLQMRNNRYSYRHPPGSRQTQLERDMEQWERERGGAGGGRNSSSNPTSNLSHEDVGRGRGKVRSVGRGGQAGTPDTQYSSKDRGEEERKGRSRKKNALAQAVSRAFDFDFSDTDREKENGEALETNLFGKKIKARGGAGGVPPVTTSAHAHGIVAPLPIGASPIPNQLGAANAASSSSTTTNMLLDFSFTSSKKKSKKQTSVASRPGTAESSSGRSANFAGLWGGGVGAGSNKADGSAAPSILGSPASTPFPWVSRSRNPPPPPPPPQKIWSPVARQLDGSGVVLFSSDADLDFGSSLSRRGAARVDDIRTRDSLVLDVSSRGSSISRVTVDEARGQVGKRTLKKRTASVPTIGFDEMKGALASGMDKALRELGKRPFDDYTSGAVSADRGALADAQLAYDSDAAVLSITSRRRPKEMVRRSDERIGG